MADKDKPPSADREARLAAALKQNLLRRKQKPGPDLAEGPTKSGKSDP
jgi:hypothetical protein